MVRLRKTLSAIGPGIFAIGYTIGTGSVTSMAKAGADYGLGLLWALALSCIFSGALMEAYGRMAAVTGETALLAVRRYLPGGTAFAWFVFAGVIIGQYTCLGGILALSAGAISEMFGGAVPPFPVAVALAAAMYAFLLVGRYSAFEKALVLCVGVMALAFLVSVVVVAPDAAVLAKAAKPILPTSGSSLLMLAAFVGTTMTAPTFVTRPLLIREKGLGVSDIGRQQADAWISATLMFVISASIVFVATFVLWANGKGIDRILDMAATLRPLAGRAAVVIFMVGVLAAGLSSIFPILMVAPLLLSDMESGRMETGTARFRWICLAACLWALMVPALGANPISVTISAQVSNVFVLPLAVLVILWLVNKKNVMGVYRAGVALNVTLAAALCFSVLVAGASVKSLVEHLRPTPPHIRGRIMECERFAGGNPLLEKAFAFLKRKDLGVLEPGRYEIAGDDAFALVQDVDLKPVDQMRIEAHRKYIDIQAPISGEETYGIGRLTDANLALPFDAEKDIGFYDQPMETVVLKPGEFVMFNPPRGAHGPSCCAGAPYRIRKVVIKVRAER